MIKESNPSELTVQHPTDCEAEKYRKETDRGINSKKWLEFTKDTIKQI